MMEKNSKTKLDQILARQLNNREIAVWGTPTRRMLRALAPYKFHIAEEIDVKKHYIVAVNDDDLDDFLTDEQSEPFQYVDDYFNFSDDGGELPFEWECHGVSIGRQTYFGDGIVDGCEEGYIGEIGHFTSINCSVDMGVNHQLDMIFTSDDIAYFFTEENKNIFENKLKADKKHPYSHGKKPMTIGNDVYIGANAFINASRVNRIGDGAIIASGAVVLEDVPPYAVVAGVPAKIKHYRYPPEMVEILLRIKWWNWSAEEINENADALMSPEIFMKRFSTVLGGKID